MNGQHTNEWGEKVTFFDRSAGGDSEQAWFSLPLRPASMHQVKNWLWIASEKLESEKGGGMQVFQNPNFHYWPRASVFSPLFNNHRCLHLCTNHWKPFFQSKMSTAIIPASPLFSFQMCLLSFCFLLFSIQTAYSR